MTITIENDRTGGLRLSVAPVEAAMHLVTTPTTILLTIWEESGDTVRGRLEHPATGNIAYLQGNRTLLSFGDQFGLNAKRFGK